MICFSFNSPTGEGECGMAVSPLPYLDDISPQVEKINSGNLAQDEEEDLQYSIDSVINNLQKDERENNLEKDEEENHAR